MVTSPVPHRDLEVIVHETLGDTNVSCRGRIVTSTADSLKETIRPLIADRKTIWLDLTEVSYMDSSGLGTVVGLFVSAQRVNAHLKLINVNEQIRQLFSITKLGQWFMEGRDPGYPQSPSR